jgi:fatty-acyl-CoA synthase
VLRAQEQQYVLGRSGAAGPFLRREFRGNAMGASLETVRPELPELREVVFPGDWSAFAASGPAGSGLPVVPAVMRP